MLNIRIKSFEDESLCRDISKIKQTQDIDSDFDFEKIPDRDEAKQLLAEIEHGRYLDESSYIDRFGCKRDIDDLSTGCKAAIIVLNNPDREVDLTSVGFNARDAIIRYIKAGKILLPTEGRSISFNIDKPEPIDVSMYGYKFYSIPRLNEYMQEEWPDKPDLDTEFIEEVK